MRSEVAALFAFVAFLTAIIALVGTAHLHRDIANLSGSLNRLEQAVSP